jgi:hypothetical protein
MAAKSASLTFPTIVPADGEMPIFAAGDRVKVAVRFPIGHFRVPNSSKRSSSRQPSTTRTKDLAATPDRSAITFGFQFR